MGLELGEKLGNDKDSVSCEDVRDVCRCNARNNPVTAGEKTETGGAGRHRGPAEEVVIMFLAEPFYNLDHIPHPALFLDPRDVPVVAIEVEDGGLGDDKQDGNPDCQPCPSPSSALYPSRRRFDGQRSKDEWDWEEDDEARMGRWIDDEDTAQQQAEADG